MEYTLWCLLIFFILVIIIFIISFLQENKCKHVYGKWGKYNNNNQKRTCKKCGTAQIKPIDGK